MSESAVTYSFSRITTFEQCARRFRYRYLDGVKEAFQGVEAFMGQCVHETLEWLFEQRESGRARSAEDAVRHYCETWDRRLRESTRVVRVVKNGTVLESYRKNGARMVESFHARRFVPDRLETIENEKHFRILIGRKYRFQGFIDRLARDGDGLLHVIDYKTGRQQAKTFQGKEADQLRAYAVAVFRETEEPELQCTIEFLRTGERVGRRLTRKDVEAFEDELVSRIDAADASTVFPPSPGILCDWCGYNDLCDATRPRRAR